MNGYINNGKRGMWISLCSGFLILGLAACNMPGTGADDPEPTVTGGESQEVELGQQEQALKKGECPEDLSLYELSYSHVSETNIVEKGDRGEEFHFKEESESDARFYLWIDSSGKVSSQDLPNSVTINVSGWVKDDTTGSCPVQYLQGAWTLSADITGTCKKGFVTLKVVEQFENTELTGSCGDPITAPGPTSGPELTLTFNLSDPGSTDGLVSGSSGDQTYVFYWYQLVPPSTRPPATLDVVPLPSP